MLKGKKILIGITGSIAAYKIPLLVRLLKKEGAEVKVILTPTARHFVTPLTLSTLSNNPVLCEPFDKDTGEWNSHVDLGNWADLYLLAPVSANTLGKMANGLADNLLVATYLAAKCPVYLAPAMDLDMYKHPSTQRNVEILLSYNNKLIAPNEGELASGLCGAGRMEEPNKILEIIKQDLKKKAPLANKMALVTAGPTYEAIDPVRFIGNHSSGRMGFAIAEELSALGAEVTLVTGPTHLKTINQTIKRIDITSSSQMHQKCKENFAQSDITVMSAAVADYTPLDVHDRKLKKKAGNLTIELIPTVDILSELGKEKQNRQILVGFALETDNELANARKKLEKKNLDFIVLNSLKDAGAGFGTQTNKITIIDNNKTSNFELKNKEEVAKDIVNKIIEKLR